MNKNVSLERELYSPMCDWLRNYLEHNYRTAEIRVLDTSQVNLDCVLDSLGVLNEYPQVIGIGMQIDVLGVVKTKFKTLLFFIEAKKTALNTHDLGQILVYSRICNPEKAFLKTSGWTGCSRPYIHKEEAIIITKMIKTDDAN